MSNDILACLKNAKRNGHVVSLHSDPTNQSRCVVGYIDQIDDAWIRLKAISPEGENAGYEVRPLDAIFRVDVNGIYENKIEYLLQNIDNIYQKNDLTYSVGIDGILITTLKEAKEKKLIVTLWTEDEDDSIIGLIDKVNESTVNILSIDDYGKKDGLILITIDEIVSIDCDNRQSQIIKFLSEKKDWNKKKEKNKKEPPRHTPSRKN